MDKQFHDDVIRYQLEKVDQGGDIQELFEQHLHYLAEVWGLDLVDDDKSPHYGDIRLPDGRHAGLCVEAFITPSSDGD